MTLPWQCHGSAMAVPWQCHGSVITVPKVSQEGSQRGLRGVSGGHPGMFWGSSGDVPGMIWGSPGRFPDVKNDEISRFFEKLCRKKKNDVEKK